MTTTLTQPQTPSTPGPSAVPPPLLAPPRPRSRHPHYLAHAVLAFIAVTMMLPFLWMLLTSVKPLAEAEQLNPIPSHVQFQNYPDLFRIDNVYFGRYFFNSFFVAAWVTFTQVLTSAMAAYAFARLRWPGRDTVFKLYLATLMVPGVVTMIPNFALLVKLHLLDSYLGLVVPASFSAFGTFLLRQFMIGLPRSLDEAAEIDGASKWRIFWDVTLPLSRAGLIALAILTFLGNYGSFFWPLVIIKSQEYRTLPIGMLYLNTRYGPQTNLMMAASVLNILPLIVIFVASQKYLVKGIQLGAVKG
jgi:ABC-type glycerol-3-phosphate transport system permease component